MTAEVKDYLLVDVPEGMSKMAIWEIVTRFSHLGKKGDIILTGSLPRGEIIHLPLPKGNYLIVGLWKDLTEEQWKEIVSHNTTIHNTWFRDYCYKMGTKKPDTVFQFDNATESGHSLLKSLGLELSSTLILKKVV